MTLMTRTLIGAATAFAILGLTASSADATHSRGKCKMRGETIAKNDSGRVYETADSEAATTTLWGCLWSRNRAYRLDVATDDEIAIFERYDNVRLRGRFVAWTFVREDISCKADCPPNYDPTTEYVKTFDLRRREKGIALSNPEAGTLSLNISGSLSWLRLAADDSREVHAWDRNGHTMLDSGQITGFRLRGTTLSWVNGGDVGRSTTLAGSAASSRNR